VYGDPDPWARMHDGGRGARMNQCLALGLAVTVLLAACAAPREREPSPEAASALSPVGDVRLLVGEGPEPRLDLAIVVFDQGLDAQAVDEAIFPTIRKAESLLLPVLLAQTVREAGAFGVVRVTPGDAARLPLRLEGRIVHADGGSLELALRLRAIDGALLLERSYRDEARPADYPVRAGDEPFADLYRAITNDLRAAVEDLTAAEKSTLQRLALMRFGADLAPATFNRYVREEGPGHLSLAGFPAPGDPMLARLQRLRRQDDLFIDAVDEQYGDLLQEVGESYNLWRAYTYELDTYGRRYRASAAERRSDARRGSFAAMQQGYATYRKVKLQEEDLRDLVKGFGGESLETVMTIDDGVYRLSGSVASRYAQWREILSRIYALETGALPPGDP